MDIPALERFRLICDGVWRDRADILTDCGVLSGEATLVRAAYWRLCKVGGTPGQGSDYAPFLDELVRQYRLEAGQPQSSGPAVMEA